MRFALPALLFIVIGFSFSCGGGDYSPKPRGYFRIEFPEKKYQTLQSAGPYVFDYPVYAQFVPDTLPNARPYWADVVYPQFNGRLHLSYEHIVSQKQFYELTEDARTFVFKHTVKATAIDEARIAYPDRKVYGIYYTIDGNTASSVQFFLTDSSRHYLRGALYFNEQPRIDSIKPVLDFLKQDLDVMIKSFRWKN